MGALELNTAPTVEPVTVDEMFSHLRIDVGDEIEMLTGFIVVARKYCERVIKGKLITQTWHWYLDAFPGDRVKVPFPPLQSVSSIKYTDEDDNELTVTASDYAVDTYSKPGRIVLSSGASWPSVTLREVNGVDIKFVCGFGDDPSAVPEEIKQGIKLVVGDLYEDRENTFKSAFSPRPVNMNAESLWADFRRELFTVRTER